MGPERMLAIEVDKAAEPPFIKAMELMLADAPVALTVLNKMCQLFTIRSLQSSIPSFSLTK